MDRLIKNRSVVDDSWVVLDPAVDEAATAVRLPDGQLLVPWSVWLARKQELIGRKAERGDMLGIWLEPQADVAEVAVDLDRFSVIGIHFPRAADGRGYSIATLLRTRYAYRGELRAFGNIGRDHLNYLQRAGFDAFAVSQPEAALASLDDFTEAYQVSASQALPLFRRVILNA